MLSLNSWIRRIFARPTTPARRTRILSSSSRRRTSLRCPLHIGLLEDRTVPAPLITSVTNNGPVAEGAGALVIVQATQSDAEAGQLTYEFDFDNNGSFEVSGRSASAEFAYADNGTYTVSVRVHDVTGSDTDSTTVTVTNVAPTLTNFAVDAAVNEGSNALVTGLVNDPGTADSFTLVLNWGDGSAAQSVTLAAGTTTFSVSHQYRDNPTGSPSGQYTVTASLSDDDGGDSAAAGLFLGPNAFGYNAYSELASDTFLSLEDPDVFAMQFSDGDTDSVAVNLGTNTFRFYGTSYSGSSLFVSTNGLITLGAAYSGVVTDLSQPAGIAAIAVFGDDLITNTHSDNLVLAKFVDSNSDGTADCLIVEWHNVATSAGAPIGVYFQAILALNTGTGSGDIVLNYLYIDSGDEHAEANLAAVGIRNAGGDALQVKSSDGVINQYVMTNLAVRFVAGARYAGTGAVTVSNVAPVVAALNLNVTTISPGGTVTLTGNLTDASPVDVLSATVNWGDGSPVQSVTVDQVTRTFTASHTYPNDPSATSYTMRVTTTDDDGASSAEANTSVTVGVPLSVSGLSATAIQEGGTTTLTGTINSSNPSDKVTVVIDWDGATHQTFTNVSVGAFSYTHQYLNNGPGGAALPITVTVSKPGSTANASTTVAVSNVAPAVQALTGPKAGVQGQTSSFTGVRGQALAFSTSFSDVGVLDTHSATWDFGDGASLTVPSATPGALSASHTYAVAGHFTVKITVRDNDGGTTVVSRPIDILAAELQTDPLGGKALVVGGTTLSDTIDLNSVNNNRDVRVRINGSTVGTFTPTGRLIVFGQSGNDKIDVENDINLSAWLYGGDGNDELQGGNGSDVLLGGAGGDTLSGGGDRDLLIGGTGADKLSGEGDGDILIAGYTDRDNDTLKLKQILDIWNSGATYASRTQTLKSSLLAAGVVHDDGVRDTLSGNSGLDWFFATLSGSAADRITDRASNEDAGPNG